MSLSGRACSQRASFKRVQSLLPTQTTNHGLYRHRSWTPPCRSSLPSYPRPSRCLSILTNPLPSHDDTIYALSSAQGKAGIAVIRVSGPHCRDVYGGLCPGKSLPRPRYATLRSLREPGKTKEPVIVDSAALVLYLPGPKTVTGEDVLELHVHGGPATVRAVLGAISKCSPQGMVRYAEPGEFTRRAFMNDRLDLAQVESLGDTLDAETEQQRRAAVSGNSGALGRTYEDWRQQLLLARGQMEALIDFSEDQHFDEAPAELLSSITTLVREIFASISLYEMASQRSELLRNGIRIALLGPPNVGKSSLMNRMVGRETSIVSKEAGTTRDIVQTSLDIRGYLCSFADTAGIRSETAVGAVEEEGIRRAKQKAAESDLVMALGSIEPIQAGGHRIYLDMDTLHLAARAPQHIVLINKCDMVDQQDLKRLIHEFRTSVLGGVRGLEMTEPLTISCKDDCSMSAAGRRDPGLIQAVIDKLVQLFSTMTRLPNEMHELFGVTERQRQLLSQCRQHLEAFMQEAETCGHSKEPDIVLAAEYLRFAAASLAQITGRGDSGDVEEVLGIVFERFCVGK